MKKLGSKKILQFTEGLSALLSSNLNIQNSLKIMSDTSSDKKIKELSANLLKGIQSGRMLYQVLSETKQFPYLYIMLVRIGETSAGLTLVFNKLDEFLKDKESRKSKTLQALLYPSLVLITVSIVLFILAFYVFPRLSDVFEVLSIDSEVSTQSFSSMVESIKTLALVIVFLIVFFILLILLCVKNNKLKSIRDRLMYKIPILKKTVISRNLSLFCFSMKTLLSSGVSTEDSLYLSKHAVGNTYFKEKLDVCLSKIKNGKSLSESLSDTEVFPSHFISWIKLNENTGDIAKTFIDMETYYKREEENLTETLMKTIEPVFIILTGILVFIVVWRFVVPLYSMLGEL